MASSSYPSPPSMNRLTQALHTQTTDDEAWEELSVAALATRKKIREADNLRRARGKRLYIGRARIDFEETLRDTYSAAFLYTDEELNAAKRPKEDNAAKERKRPKEDNAAKERKRPKEESNAVKRPKGQRGDCSACEISRRAPDATVIASER